MVMTMFPKSTFDDVEMHRRKWCVIKRFNTRFNMELKVVLKRYIIYVYFKWKNLVKTHRDRATTDRGSTIRLSLRHASNSEMCANMLCMQSAGETMVSDRGLERDSEKKNVKNRRKSRMTEKSEGARSIERCESMSRERKDRI